jgi:sugar diacid utilization regulator
MQRLGLSGEFTTVLIAFDYRDNGRLIRSLVNGTTFRNGSVWVADLSGISSTDDPIKYHGLLLQMSESFRMNPRWQAEQRAQSQRRHEATMALIEAGTAAMTRRHEANMAAIQASSARHQQRMAALQASGDARLNAWKQQQAQSDASQERFLNYIKGENTVVSGSGAASQVQAGQDRYFRKQDRQHLHRHGQHQGARRPAQDLGPEPRRLRRCQDQAVEKTGTAP